MQVFAVALEFNLDRKPKWFDAFRKKYDRPYEYHITIKHKTYIKDADIKTLKIKLKEFAKTQSKIPVTFEKIEYGKSTSGNVIMILANRNDEVTRLQAKLHKLVDKYGKNVKPSYRKFELDFKPHISIARGLDSRKLEEAKAELGANTKCKAVIKKVVLGLYNNKDDDFYLKKITFNFGD